MSDANVSYFGFDTDSASSDVSVSWIAFESNESSIDVNVSYFDFDADNTSSDVSVSWIALDTNASPINVNVGWFGFDTNSSGGVCVSQFCFDADAQHIEEQQYGGAARKTKNRNYSIFSRTQDDEEKNQERIELGIIEKTKPITDEKIKVVAKKDNAEKESSDYWSLHLYEYLLNEQIAKIHTELLLQKTIENVILIERQNAIQQALYLRQLEIEKSLQIEYQRIIEEDMIFVMSIMSEL